MPAGRWSPRERPRRSRNVKPRTLAAFSRRTSRRGGNRSRPASLLFEREMPGLFLLVGRVDVLPGALHERAFLVQHAGVADDDVVVLSGGVFEGHLAILHLAGQGDAAVVACRRYFLTLLTERALVGCGMAAEVLVVVQGPRPRYVGGNQADEQRSKYFHAFLLLAPERSQFRRSRRAPSGTKMFVGGTSQHSCAYDASWRIRPTDHRAATR